jgi:hypothetical protein
MPGLYSTAMDVACMAVIHISGIPAAASCTLTIENRETLKSKQNLLVSGKVKSTRCLVFWLSWASCDTKPVGKYG